MDCNAQQASVLYYKMAESFFQKSPVKHASATLCTMKDGSVVPGYEGNEADFYTHINFYTMHRALNELLLSKSPPYTFVETGCAAHGTQSTLLWDTFVNKHGGRVFSVDLNPKSVDTVSALVSPKTRVTCDDSVHFLKMFTQQIDFLYLDSYDVDFSKPGDSAFHHWKEFQSCRHLLQPNSIVLIDDTPVHIDWFDDGANNGTHTAFTRLGVTRPIGKGSLVEHELRTGNATHVMHQYQTLWKVHQCFSNVSSLM